MRIYLAIQNIHYRRWSPDSDKKFLGWEPQTIAAEVYMKDNNYPTWPDCLRQPLPKTPFRIEKQQEEQGALL